MKENKHTIFAFICALSFSLFWVFRDSKKQVSRAFYVWESAKYDLTNSETKTLSQLKVEKLYVKLFEVEKNDVLGIHPTAKSEFQFTYNDELSAEIIPVVYIRNEVFKGIKKAEMDEFVSNFIFLLEKRYKERMDELYNLKEIQIDCDWTESTQENYFTFLKKLKSKVNYQLSATLRLYAYKFPDKIGVLPTDRAMLMCYNLLNVHENRHKNSILDLNELEKYLVGADNYPIPLDLALPTYQAMHVYQNNIYVRSLHQNECDILSKLKKHSKLWYAAKEDFVVSNLFIRKGDKIKYENIDHESMLKALSIVKNNVSFATDYTLSFYDLNEFDLKTYTNENLDSYFTH
jgi:hypothetical protein